MLNNFMKEQKQLASVEHSNTLSQLNNGNRATEKEKLIMKILKYQGNRRFGEKIKKGLGIKYTRQQLLKCSNENLEAILYRIKTFLNNVNMDAVWEHMARHTAKGYEELVSNFYDIDGFSDLVLSNPAFWDAFERYKIESLSLFC